MTPRPARRVLRFEDNSLLPLLYGQHDANLVRIEHQLGVTLASRGNQVTISGSDDAAAQTAATVLTSLWDRLQQGRTIVPQDIDATVRMSRGRPATAGGPDPTDCIRTRRRLIEPRSPTQVTYIRALARHVLVFGLGPAGTGKTYLAVAHAVSMLDAGHVDRIIVSRPAVEAGERLGFLPGDLKEKVDPYLRPLYDALYDMLPGEQVQRHLETGTIEVAPLAFMRGRTLSHAYVILDEAQNTTVMQMRMFLTRMGENGHMAVTGDPTQVDLPRGERSGLLDAVQILDGEADIAFVRFTDVDVVRHPMVTRIVRAYERRDAARAAARGVEGETSTP